MSRRRPLIGITGPRRRFPFAWWATSAAVRACGGAPLRLRPGEQLPDALSGLIVGGGADIAPGLYDPTRSDIDPPDAERDAFELEALRIAEDRALPILGICRGSQLLNVFRGGSLDPDVRGRRVFGSNRSTLLPTRPVRVFDGSRLGALLLRRACRVNAIHRQAVDRLGDGLVRCAEDADGIPQAVEDPVAPFVVGVQWHPEYLAWERLQRRLFSGLVRAARQVAPSS